MKQFDPRSNTDTITSRLLDAQWRRIADCVRHLVLDWANRNLGKKLDAFWRKLHGLRLLDPACGCGNFLVVTYRELRRFDFDVVRAIRLRTGQLVTNVDVLKNVFITQFHGLEIKDFKTIN